MMRVDEDGDGEREPAAAPDLHDVRAEEGEVDDEEDGRDRERDDPRDLPRLAGVDVEEDRRDPHRRRHGDAVRRGEGARRAEREDEPDAGDGEDPVDRREVDLPDLPLRGVVDPQARHVAELDRLAREREGARDHGLRGDDRGRRGEEDERQEAPLRRELEERVVGRGRARQEERALAEVVQEERRKDEREPADADRPGPEVPHVGVERLAPRHGEEDRAEEEEAASGRSRAKKRAPWTGLTAARTVGASKMWTTPRTARTTNQTTITGPKTAPTLAGPLLLDEEEDDEDGDDDRAGRRA